MSVEDKLKKLETLAAELGLGHRRWTPHILVICPVETKMAQPEMEMPPAEAGAQVEPLT
jgi:hypothetical protein